MYLQIANTRSIMVSKELGVWLVVWKRGAFPVQTIGRRTVAGGVR